jgi:hypothetical protein
MGRRSLWDGGKMGHQGMIQAKKTPGIPEATKR